MSIDLNTTCLDNVFINPNDLAQLMLVVFEKETVKKTRLLGKVKNRCDPKGICAAEIVTILLVDFLTLTENNIQSKHGSQMLTEVSRFMKAATKSATINKLSLTNRSTENEKNENNDQFSEIEEKPDKKRSISTLKSTQEDRLDRIVRKAEVKRSKTPGYYENQKVQVFTATKTDKIKSVNYIVQQKNKAEENLIKAASLLKKSNKDYNELLSFASSMHRSFGEMYNKLQAAQRDAGVSYSKSNVPFPIKKKVAEGYDFIMTCKARSIQNELAPILEYFIDDKVAMKALRIDGKGKVVSQARDAIEIDKENMIAN